VNRFSETLTAHSLPLRRSKTEVLQVNLGKLCNLACVHCHVNAGPKRKEIMTRETVDRVVDWFARSEIPTIDLTGGAPEMIPDFRYFIERVKTLRPSRRVIDRCNLTILLETGYEGLAQFLARHKVEIIASMPCYTAENVNAQRGQGVFDSSIKALRVLNSLGYGSDLPLHLVYNPVGAFLPGPEAELEADYKRELKKHCGIIFNNLYTITNLPIARFASYLRHNNKLEEYTPVLQTLSRIVTRLRLHLTKERSAAGTACSLHGVSRAGSVGAKKPSRRYRSIRSCLLFVFVGNLLRTHTDNEWERESYGAMAIFPLASFRVARETGLMKNYTKILFSILAAAICSAGFAAEPQSCKKTGKNCPMNDNKKCNCGKNCSC